MDMAVRTGAWSGKALPYLRRVAYLESDGNQIIDTGLVAYPDDNQVLEVAFAPTERYDGYLKYHICGSTNESRLSFGLVWQCLEVYAWCDWNTYPVITNPVEGRFYSVKLTTFSVYVDGVQVSATAKPYGTTPHICLFCAGGPTGYNRRASSKIASFKFTNGVESVDMIPVLDLSGRPAMYDEVSGQLFYNQGTGEFTWGEL